MRRLSACPPSCILALLLACFVSHAAAQSLTITAPASFTIHPGDQNVPLPVTLSADSVNAPVSVTLRGLPSGIAVAPLTLAPGSSGSLLISASVFADREDFPATTIGGPNSATRTVAVVAAAGTTQATANTAFTVSLSNPGFAPAPDKIDLPIVRIDTGGAPLTSKDIDVPGTITITSADGATSYLPNSSDSDNTATFHVHGSTTAAMQKRPYNIKLNTSLDLLSTMGLYCPYNKDPSQSTCDKSKSYILLANYDDKSLLRDWAASALANGIPMGGDYLSSPAGSPSPSKTALMPWAPHSLFVELYINNQYEGNYQLTEKVNVDSHRLNISELSESDTGAGGGDITGGYLMEIDQHRDEAYVLITPQQLPIGLIDPDFSPDPEVPQQTAYISDYVTQAENALVYGDPADPVNGWRAYFDEATLVNFYLVNEIMGNSDGGAFFSSDYLYKQQGNPLLYMGPVWDFDISAGNVNYQPVANPTSPWMQQRSPWYLHLFADPSFKADVAAQFNALKKNGVFDSWLNSIEQQATALGHSQANNFARWPVLGITVWPNTEAAGTYSGEVAFLTTYLRLRIAWLDSVLNNKTATATALRLSSATVGAGSALTLSAAVTGAGSPGGTVTFLLNGIPGPSASLDGDGKANLTVSDLPVGSYSVVAVYNGDGQNALSSSDPATIAIEPPLIGTTTSVAPSSALIDSGDSTTLAAAVIPTAGTVAPTGSIAFTANGSPLGSAPLAADGTATLTTANLPTGNASVQAIYSGDSIYNGSSSPLATVAVQPLGSFALSADAQSVVSQANTASVTLTITPQDGFHHTVTLQCASGLPAGVTCDFAPATVTPSSAPVISLLRISVAAQAAQMSGASGKTPVWPGKLAGAFVLALLIWPARRRRWPLAALFLFFGIGLAISGCGGNGQQAKPMSVTVTATSGTLSQSTVLQVTLGN